MRIALVQMSMEESWEANLDKSLASMREAASKGAELVCFPEIQFSPFFPQFPGGDASAYAMGIDHFAIRAMQQACREQNLIAIPNLYLDEGGKRYDASPVIERDGTVLGISKTVHVVQMPFFYEQDYYTPSDSGFHVYHTSRGRVGVVICFDRHYPESLRSCALKGAQLTVIPTANVKGEPLEFFEWELRVAAVQSGVFSALCNRVGLEEEMEFCGQSLLVDPNGELVAKADDSEQVLYAEVDLDLIERSREARPYLKLRRSEFCTLGTTDMGA
ncbi:MAG TPA: carbon-nitrogen hydrolase family protein [Anaerolineae bacterium]|nr:carbon-nitrogen hydrolase family protein [Anaerolineae bacterium]